ncbi:MAG: transketolase [Candidatus Aminicenantaceae bacterium]
MQSVVKRMKREIVHMAAAAGEGHIPSAFSILDILWVLYDRIIEFDPKNPASDSRDRFILSKGHGTLALYVVLAEKGFFPREELEKFATKNGILGGHPDCNKVPGVEASTGSLGHGMPMGVGVAMALRIRGVDRRTIVLTGDQECNEGSIWEAALLAAHHKISKLTCVVDYNHSGDRALTLGDLCEKFGAFGWSSMNINGHDHKEIYDALKKTHETFPTAIIAQTIKGHGCKRMENNPAWHHRAPSEEELSSILEELL